MKNRVAIVTDSVANIPAGEVEKYGIEVVPIQLLFGVKAYRDGIDLLPGDFYRLLRQAKKLPTTAAALPGAFIELFSRLGRTNDVLCITLSSRLSGMYNAARLAVETIKEMEPGLVVELFDSKFATMAQGLIVLAAARAAAAGKNIAEVTEAARHVQQRVHLLAMLDTLSYLVKGGRAPRIAGFATSMLRVKPILTIADGEVVALTNPRTTGGALSRMLSLMEEKLPPGSPIRAAVIHADAPGTADDLRSRIAARFNCRELFVTEFTPVMGAHTGPGVVGTAFHADE